MSNMANINRYKLQKQKLFEIFNNLLRVLNVSETKICHDSSIRAMSPSWLLSFKQSTSIQGSSQTDLQPPLFFLLHLIKPFFTGAVYEV